MEHLAFRFDPGRFLFLPSEVYIRCFLAARGKVEKARRLLAPPMGLVAPSSYLPLSRRRRRRLTEEADDDNNSCASYRAMLIPKNTF